ncbi:MAG TPA: hypothetical protein EYG95_04355 [Campylobacterales bacterium]|nr:hypothetical protein [Campylobacterales bacterium]
MLKTLLSAVVMLVLLAGCSTKEKPASKMGKQSWMFQSAPSQQVTILQFGEEKEYCPNCGMTLSMFYKSNHAATLDGKVKQYCSIHCVAEDLMQGKDVRDIKVVDVTSLKFVDALSATYVVGSAKKGTMTGISKYAFASQSDAGDFMHKYGGEMMGFTEALEISKKDFSPEVKAKMKAKKMMMAKKGEKVYKMKCTQTTLPKFNSVSEAKAYISANNICNGLKGKPLQALGIYLFTR